MDEVISNEKAPAAIMKFDYMYLLTVWPEYSLLGRSISGQKAPPMRPLAWWLSLGPLRARRDRNGMYGDELVAVYRSP